jgi:hypothetical protein
VSEKHFRLEAIRADGKPKCVNCGFWQGQLTMATSAECDLNNHVTLDLSVCSGWRTADTQQEVIE